MVLVLEEASKGGIEQVYLVDVSLCMLHYLVRIFILICLWCVHASFVWLWLSFYEAIVSINVE